MALCAFKDCDNKTAKLSKYCSLACAELEISGLRKRIREAKSLFSRADIEASGYVGESSAEAILALENPFGGRSAAHYAFELFRESGLRSGLHREEIIDRLIDACDRKNIPLRSPRERVRRVMTDTRALGFELVKDYEGRFRLTGRRVD